MARAAAATLAASHALIRYAPSSFALLRRLADEQGGDARPLVEAIFHDRRLEDLILFVCLCVFVCACVAWLFVVREGARGEAA